MSSVTSIPDRLRTPPDGVDVGLHELMAVREIAHAFLTADRPEDVYQVALDRVTPVVGATFACVYLIDEGSELMRLAAACNWPERYARFLGQMRVRLGYGPSGEAASERRTIEVLDLFADPTLEDWHEVATELGFRSFAALPLQTTQAVHGTVTFYFASAKAATGGTRQLMRTVADQMAATAEKARLIDELRKANAALTASNTRLERQYAEIVEARRVKDEFLTNVTHELRTPLTTVMGYISLLQEGLGGPVTAEQQVALGEVKQASEHVVGLIDDLLDLTALKRGGVESTLADVDPRDPLRDALATAKGKRELVSLEIDEPHIVPLMKTDRRAVAKALKSLIENAFKFTRKGLVRVSIDVIADRVVYRIEDTGVGIPVEAKDVVFDEFRQADGGLTREFGGSGLGLSLARRLAQLVQGDVTLASSSAAGSTFELSVPLTSSS
jgi:signal transduction histidine kinase